MKTQVIYPGTFDPITFGHIDIIKRSLKIFDSVIIAVASNESKKPLFSADDRVSMIREVVGDLEGVEVEAFSCLLVDYAKKKGITNVIRGIRAVSDFEYEFQMALTNRKLQDEIEFVFLMPDEKYSYVTSSMIKEIHQLGGDVADFVPSYIKEKLLCH